MKLMSFRNNQLTNIDVFLKKKQQNQKLITNSNFAKQKLIVGYQKKYHNMLTKFANPYQDKHKKITIFAKSMAI